MNKDTMMMVGLAVVLIATFYLYKEIQKNKLEIKKFSDSQLPKSILKVPAASAQVPAQPPAPVVAADEPVQ